MNKRERVIASIKKEKADFVPACFSLHFNRTNKTQEEDLESHLEFFRETDADISKIMNENLLPDFGPIVTAEDWKVIPHFNANSAFIKNQIELTKRILSHLQAEDFSIGTLHGICASSIHPIEARYGYEAVRALQVKHFREKKEVVLDAFKRITEGLIELVRQYAASGVDGIYYAALGGEERYFSDEEFEEAIAVFDKAILKEIKENGLYSFLHICKDGLKMERYKSYAGYFDVVNWGIYEAPCSIEEMKNIFPDACIMGGLANRSGVIVDGSIEELEQEVERLVKTYGKEGFILGADCTLPTEIPYSRIKSIVDTCRKTIS